jgi:hypothetical protein
MATTITMSVAGLAYVAYNPGVLTDRASTVADQATCRAVDSAIVAYASVHATQPRAIADLEPYVRGDISDYRIVRGMAAGPGCAIG